MESVIIAIGRCGLRTDSVRIQCLDILLSLAENNTNEKVVSESLAQIKLVFHSQYNFIQQLKTKNANQNNNNNNKKNYLYNDKDDQDLSEKELNRLQKHLNLILIKISKIFERIQSTKGKANIIWLIGEYCQEIPKIAPDFLRKLSITFGNESSEVKLQILRFSAKLLLRKPENTIALIFQYICNIAKYDVNYDVRDQARLFRSLFLSSETLNLKKHSHLLILLSKPTPSDPISFGFQLFKLFKLIIFI